MLNEQHLKLIAVAFEQFMHNTYSSAPMVESDDPLQEMQWTPIDNKQVKETWHLDINEKILFLDYLYMYANFPDIKQDGVSSVQLLDKYINSEESFDIIKVLKMTANEIEFLQNIFHGEFEIRLFNIRTMHRFTEMNSKFKNRLVTLRGVVYYRWDEIRQFVTQRRWTCNECGEPTIQFIKRGKKLTVLKKPCNNKIGEGESVFICRCKKWTHIEDTKYEDLFRIKIEALPQDTPNKLEFPTFTIEFTHNLCNEKFLNEVITGQAFEFTGFVRLAEQQTKTGESIWKPYLEVMSFREIEKRTRRLVITEEEKKEIKEFLKKPDAIDELVKIFGQRVIGYEREKKFFLILKALQEGFNKKKETANAKDYLCHMLLVGDYATGKSEFAEVCLDICENGNYIIGSSTTQVGLTGITERDEMTGHFSIQSGMLARSAGDTLVIEEFDKKENKAEFGILNEAMSKYEYTVTKAGKSRKFRCPTTIIIISNPIGKKFDPTESLFLQVDMGGDLISRFSAISLILEGKDMDRQLEIDNVMIDRVSPELIEADRFNAEYIKKCFKVASEIDPKMNTDEVREYLHTFTKQTFAIKQQVIGEDKKFWSNIGNPRNRGTLLKLIKGVAMLHLHLVPTKEDMEEATQLFYKFQKDIVENPQLLDADELATGKSYDEIEDSVKQKMSTLQWEEKIEDKKDTKRGRMELLLTRMKEIAKKSGQGMVHIEDLKAEALEHMGFGDYEFEELIEKMQKQGMIIEPKPSFLKVLT